MSKTSARSLAFVLIGCSFVIAVVSGTKDFEANSATTIVGFKLSYFCLATGFLVFWLSASKKNRNRLLPFFILAFGISLLIPKWLFPYHFHHGTAIGWYTPLYGLGFAGVGALWGFIVLFLTAIRWKEKRPGRCVKCDYDLRGSKERCPECGEHFEPSKLSADC